MPRFHLALPLLLAVVLNALVYKHGKVCADESSDRLAIQSHLIARMTKDGPSESAVRQLITRLRPDGSWPDVDYGCRQRGAWRTYLHMARTYEMACAYRCRGHALAGAATLREAITRAMNHWLEHDYRNPNWWYGRIGIPRLAAPTLILMGNDLPEATRNRAIDQLLNRSQMGMTGQNKVWCAGIALMKGLLTEDDALIQEARNAILSELRITTEEGIQPDFSFHQHGPQQQWGNYGASFGRDMLEWVAVFRGTRFAVSPQQRQILSDYLLEGPAWIVWRGMMDISGCGRQIFPGCQSSKGQGILRQLRDLKQSDRCSADAVDRILDSQSTDSENRLVGHKHYWRSDIAVHRRPDWYASVKMSSRRVIGAETCNSENLLGLHLGDGVSYFLCSGREYEDIFPLWDWRRLPGTTCVQNDQSLVPSSRRCRGGSDFVGGVTDGRIGVSVLAYRRNEMRANKSWFFLDDGVMCLGAGIADNSGAPVFTSIEQSRLSGPVLVSTGGASAPAGRGDNVLRQPDWIHHAGIGYCLLQPTDVQMECIAKEGDWRKVHDQTRGERIVRGEVFSLWIDHGNSPQGDTYAYSVHPASSPKEMPLRFSAYRKMPIVNTETLQAVQTDRGQTILAAFHQPGRLPLGEHRFVEVDTACLLILRFSGDTASVYLADPSHSSTEIGVKLAVGSVTAQQQRIQLPQAGLAGSTVSAKF